MFDTDAQRRVLAHLPLPDEQATTISALVTRLVPDESQHQLGLTLATGLHRTDALEEVLDELAAKGYAKVGKDTVKMTKLGFDALNGPNGYEPPPLTEEAIKAAKAADAKVEAEDLAHLAEEADEHVKAHEQALKEWQAHAEDLHKRAEAVKADA